MRVFLSLKKKEELDAERERAAQLLLQQLQQRQHHQSQQEQYQNLLSQQEGTAELIESAVNGSECVTLSSQKQQQYQGSEAVGAVALFPSPSVPSPPRIHNVVPSTATRPKVITTSYSTKKRPFAPSPFDSASDVAVLRTSSSFKSCLEDDSKPPAQKKLKGEEVPLKKKAVIASESPAKTPHSLSTDYRNTNSVEAGSTASQSINANCTKKVSSKNIMVGGGNDPREAALPKQAPNNNIPGDEVYNQAIGLDVRYHNSDTSAEYYCHENDPLSCHNDETKKHVLGGAGIQGLSNKFDDAGSLTVTGTSHSSTIDISRNPTFDDAKMPAATIGTTTASKMASISTPSAASAVAGLSTVAAPADTRTKAAMAKRMVTNKSDRASPSSSKISTPSNKYEETEEEDSKQPAKPLSLRRPLQEEPKGDTTIDEAIHREFLLALKKEGLEIVEQDGDGNCLFRAISLQVYGDPSMHLEVRHKCLDFMTRDKEHFSQFITDEPFDEYLRRKRKDGVHGDNLEVQAISELFNRPIEVYVPGNGSTPLNIFHAEYKTQDAPIRLSYHDGNHYNAVIDPIVPTAGLGLGLPGLQPGLADKMQMAKAVAESDRMADQSAFERALKESEDDELQRAIKESSMAVDSMYQYKAMSLSDCDATNFEIEQAVLESSLKSFRTQEHGRKQAYMSTGASPNGVIRRKREASPPSLTEKSQLKNSTVTVEKTPMNTESTVASMPAESRQLGVSSTAADSESTSVAVARAVMPASVPAVASRPNSSHDIESSSPVNPMMVDHYPQSVQELVMNGFELKRVVRAYELVGDNFDNLLNFLMSTTST